jgi:hypothetical protein
LAARTDVGEPATVALAATMANKSLGRRLRELAELSELTKLC